jgi:hypothetical protein
MSDTQFGLFECRLRVLGESTMLRKVFASRMGVWGPINIFENNSLSRECQYTIK